MTSVVGSAVLLAAVFISFLTQVAPIVGFGHAVDYGEGVLLDQVRRVTEEPGLYPSFDRPPYVIDNYPPVYPWIVALFPRGEQNPFLAARLVSLVSTIGAAWLIALLVRRRAGEAPALLAAAVFLSLPEIRRFAPLARIDALGLGFALLGCVFLDRSFAEGPTRKGWRGSTWARVWACVAFGASIYTRHSLLVFPVVGFFELWRREGWRSLRWPLGLLSGGILFYLGLHVATDGRVYGHLIYYNILDYQWRDACGRFFQQLWPWRYALVIAALLALWPRREEGRVRRPHQVLFGVAFVFMGVVFIAHATGHSDWLAFEWELDQFYPIREAPLKWPVVAMVLLAAAAIGRVGRRSAVATGALALLFGTASALLVGRAGSNVNYLFELLAVLSVLGGVAIARGPRLVRISALVLVVATIGCDEWESLDIRRHEEKRRGQIARRDDRLLKMLRDVEGPIYTEEPSIAVLLGKPLEYQTFMYRHLIDTQTWPPFPLTRDIREQRFSAIVVAVLAPSINEPGKPYEGASWVLGPDATPRSILKDWIQVYYEAGVGAEVIEWLSSQLLRKYVVLVPRRNPDH